MMMMMMTVVNDFVRSRLTQVCLRRAKLASFEQPHRLEVVRTSKSSGMAGVGQERGKDIADEVARGIFARNIPAASLVSGAVLFPYSGKDFKSKLLWDQAMPWRVLMTELLQAADGILPYQASLSRSFTRFAGDVGAMATEASPDGLTRQNCVIGIYRLRMMMRHAISARKHEVPVPQRFAEMQGVLNAVDVAAYTRSPSTATLLALPAPPPAVDGSCATDASERAGNAVARREPRERDHGQERRGRVRARRASRSGCGAARFVCDAKEGHGGETASCSIHR